MSKVFEMLRLLVLGAEVGREVMIIEGSRVVSALFFNGMKRWCMLIFCQGIRIDSYMAYGRGVRDVDIRGGWFIDSIA